VSENRVLKKIFGAKWKEITVEWRKWNNKYLPYPYKFYVACEELKFCQYILSTVIT
jgi:hypothetical protein